MLYLLTMQRWYCARLNLCAEIIVVEGNQMQLRVVGKICECRGETKWCGHSDDSVDNNNKTGPLYHNVFRIVRQSEK